ncbi:MAG: DUF4340 domain-containing protein [bacterium]
MSWRKTIFLGIVLALLAGLYLWDHQRVSRQKGLEEEQKKLFPWKLEDVSEVVLQRPSDTIRLVKEEGKGWLIQEPVKAKADQEEARRLVEGLLRSKKDRVIAEEPSDLQTYGLKEPQFLVRVKGKSPEEERSLLLGAKNPTEVYYFCQFKGQKEVFLVSDILRRDVEKPLLELRDKSVLAFNPEKVQSLRVWGAGKEVLLLKESDKKWSIGEAKELQADTDAVQSLLFRLSRLRALAFEDTPRKSLAELGLDPPERSIMLKLSDPEEERVLLVGREVQDQDTGADKKPKLWARLQGDSPVVQVESSQVGELPLEPDAWRSKVLISFEREKVERLELITGEQTLLLRKVAQNQWEIEEPERFSADPVKVSDLLWTLKDVRAARFPGKGVSQQWLDPQVMQARVWLEARDEPLELTIGQPTPEGQAHYAKAPAQEEIVEVSKAFLEDMKKFTVWELREKRFVSFEVPKVKRVLLKWEGQEMELRRKGESEWQLQRPEQKDLETYKVSGLLWSVREARFEGFPPQRPSEAEMGMDSPEFQIQVFEEGKQPVASLSVGAQVKDSPGLRYAWSDPQGQLYLVGSKFLEQISKDIKSIAPSRKSGSTGSGG